MKPALVLLAASLLAAAIDHHAVVGEATELVRAAHGAGSRFGAPDELHTRSIAAPPLSTPPTAGAQRFRFAKQNPRRVGMSKLFQILFGLS